ncbi:uncharacterized protein LOC130993920 [Salvia miltiorrhiza]|uniref:uncharacterized protein LOC130993920 n=1 Tax=Salvia miltiorrhiza TaxID=226208 RepID=UPI0025ACAB5F|nr:uncharacterized protein LOC130993920 [Salvia miltiorrhiza]
MAEWFDDTSSSLSDGVAQEIIDEINKQKQLIAQTFPQPEPERIIHHRSYVYRDRVAAHLRLMQDYFNDNPTSNNGVNVLIQSPLFSDVLEGTSAPVIFEANPALLLDGLLLVRWHISRVALLRQESTMATNPKEASSARSWYVEHLKDIMMCCIILHNMIVESEGQGATHWRDDDAGHGASTSDSTEIARKTPPCFEEYVQRDALLRDRQIHAQLQHDLIKHVWARFGPLGPE